MGSTRLLADERSAVAASYRYDAWGELLGSTGDVENAYLFTGEQYDAGLDQYYLRARYYDQGVGRFTQMDTWNGKECTPITLNKYAYAYQDPQSVIDPSGNIGLFVSFSGPNLASPVYLRNQELRDGAAKSIKMIRSLCRGASGVVSKLARHHVVLKFLGGKNQWDPALLVKMETAVHQQLHTLLDIALKMNGLVGGRAKVPGGATKFYESLYRSNPGMRNDTFKVLRKVAEVFDKACPKNPGGSLTGKLDKLKDKGFR